MEVSHYLFWFHLKISKDLLESAKDFTKPDSGKLQKVMEAFKGLQSQAQIFDIQAMRATGAPPTGGKGPQLSQVKPAGTAPTRYN